MGLEIAFIMQYADKGALNDTTVVNYNEGTLASSSGDYRMPLVWIDLEMTGEFYVTTTCFILLC